MSRDGSTADGTDTAAADAGEPDGAVGTIKRALSSVVSAWLILVRAFSWLLVRIVAVLLFVVGFVPYSIVMRLIGFDPLERDPDPSADSYWTDADATNASLEAFRRLY